MFLTKKEVPGMKVVSGLIQLLCLVIWGTLIYNSFRKIGLSDGVSTIKTLGFWGLCVVIMSLDMMLLGITRAKGSGVVITANIAGILVCVLAYGLLFAQ